MIRRRMLIGLICCMICSAVYLVTEQQQKKLSADAAPIITMDEEDISIQVEDGDEAILQGITATDAEDGDVTDSLVIESIGHMIGESHTRQAVIAAFDHYGNVTKVTRRINYTNYTSPKVKITKPLIASITNPGEALEGVTVKDVIDGDLTDQVQLITKNQVNKDITDKYDATLMVVNSCGDTIDMPVTLTLYTSADRSEAPEMELTRYILYVKKGEERPKAFKYLKSVTMNGRTFLWNYNDDCFHLGEEEDEGWVGLKEGEEMLTKSQIKVINKVKMDEAGTYEIVYYVKKYKSNFAARIRLIVVVTE